MRCGCAKKLQQKLLIAADWHFPTGLITVVREDDECPCDNCPLASTVISPVNSNTDTGL